MHRIPVLLLILLCPTSYHLVLQHLLAGVSTYIATHFLLITHPPSSPCLTLIPRALLKEVYQAGSALHTPAIQKARVTPQNLRHRNPSFTTAEAAAQTRRGVQTGMAADGNNRSISYVSAEASSRSIPP
ncbi:hypothetical protein CPSG_07442 [Coccidioides posadasii str. Silveira]|uniref:Uncharacterized protein n=1 Tax=Coccidioides posadasii (strain RMSCC 757 / Silveira) TaxID=443226 RepID=E9DC90_COCPS|nr:hypothetical protein CPSG_07442 [Coccidioides posadasii str. Silveira]